MRQFCQYKFIFLLFVAVMSSGFRCWFFCIDQTGMQNDYVEARDECRSFSQAKIEDSANDSEKAIQTKMVMAFSDCMTKKGWDVTYGDKNKTASKEQPAPTIAPIIAPIPKNEVPAPVVAPTATVTPATPIAPVATRKTLPPPLVQNQPALIIKQQEMVKAPTVAPVSVLPPAQIQQAVPQPVVPLPVQMQTAAPLITPKPLQIQQQLPQVAQIPAQIQTAAPVQAVTAKALDAPQKTTAAVNKMAKYREMECSIARRSASLSAGAATKTKECNLECTTLLKTSPKILPSACPVAIEQK